MLLLANLALSEASERTLGDGAIFKAGMLAMTGDGAGAKEILHNKKNEMKEEYEDYKAYQKFKEERHEQQEYRYGGGGGSGGGGGGGGYRQQGGYQHYGYGERPGYRGNGGQQWGNGGRYRSMPMEKAEAAPAADGAKPRGGWMPFAQQGAATGAGFGAQGMDTAFRFFTDPNFDFQKEGQAYQASGAATGNAFGGLSQGMLPQQQQAAAAPEAATAPEASAMRAASQPVRKHLVLGPFSMGLVVLAVAAAVIGAIRARARAVWVKGLKYARQTNADEFV